MITRIELTNFMSHAHTVIEPAPGLTVLVGPNNCGKSAVVAALQILAHNDNSTYVLRHGEKECSVQVTTDDGHTILWKRKTSASYEIDGEKKDRLKIGAPPESLQPILRLPLVEGSGEDDFDVHFGAQKSPIFLLNSSAATAARFFASSSDASRLVAMQKKHKDKLAERQKEKNRLEAESKQLTAELEWVAPAVELDRQLKLAEQEYSELLRRSEQLDGARQAAAALETQLATANRCAALATSLSPLMPPPALTPTEPLAQLIGAIERGQAAQELAAARTSSLTTLSGPPALFDVAALSRTTEQLLTLSRAAERAEAEGRQLAMLPAPPQLAETTPLEKLIEQVSSASRQVKRWESAVQMAASVVPPPQPGDIVPLGVVVASLEAAAEQVASCAQAQEVALAELSAAAEALREAADGQLCPLRRSARRRAAAGAAAWVWKGTCMSDANYVGLLLIGDPHLEGRQPGFRKDDYPNVILEKLAWSLDYAAANRLLPCILGDLFDKPRDNPTWMLVKLLDLLQGEVIGLYGNHDCADPELNDNDSLSLLVKAGRLRLIGAECPWIGQVGGRSVVVGGSSYRHKIPEKFVAPVECGPTPLVVWLTHHDVLIPGYDEGRIKPIAIPGVELLINGHIHRRLEEVRVGATRWLTPGNISRRSRNDASRAHVPAVLRIDVSPASYELSYVEVPHRPFDEVFHEAMNEIPTAIGGSAFVAGLAELQARRTTSGAAGLLPFLEQNLGQYQPAVAAEIMCLAKEVIGDDE